MYDVKNKRLKGIFLFFVFVCFNALAQQKVIVSGLVSDSQGPVPGVSVLLKGEQQGTTTDASGAYSIEVEKGNTLIFRNMGYAEKEVVIGDSQQVDVFLEATSEGLDEVVIIGYGSQQRRDLTGSVSTVSQEAIQDIPVPGVDQKLVGKVAGVQIRTITGTPGGGSSIKIRGSGSIGAGDDPLFVVDGFPLTSSEGRASNPLNVLNPDDIESITVLKDASSTAIYGSRGANGVVVITTKKGETGAPRVQASLFGGVQQVPRKGRPDMLNAHEFAQFRREMIEDAFASRGEVATDQDIPEAYRNPNQYGVGTNWYDEVFRTAPQSNINASVNGGSENARYAFSLGYLNQEGTLRYTGFERITARANIDSDIGEKFKIGVTLAPTYSTQRLNDFENSFTDVITSSLWLSPLIPVHDASGNRTPYITSPDMFGAPNPLNKLEFGGNTNKVFRGLGGAFAEYEVLEGLKARYNFNVDYSTSSGFVFNPSFVGGVNAPPETYVANSGTNRSSNFNWLSEFLLTYDKEIAPGHRIDVVAGVSAQKERNEMIQINATNYPDDKIETINDAALIQSWDQDIQEWALLSYLARVNYSLKDKWLFTGTIRRDGSSRFGTANKYGTFPSAAVAYRLGEEDFLKGKSWLSDLKLRTSYGLAGNFNIGNYTYLSNISSANYAFDGVLGGGRIINSLRNPGLTWEESAQLDIGIDLGLFNNRLNFTIDAYNRLTQNMLFDAEIPLSSGFSTAIVNSGRIRNSGLEIAVNSRNLIGEFKWTTDFNIALNRNKVLALNENNDPIFGGRSGSGLPTHITQVGHPIGQFFGYVADGIYATPDDFDNSPKHVTSVLGSIKYRDVDGNGVIEPVNDFDIIGNPQPNFTFGITNQFNYKNFDLNIVVTGSQGGQLLRQAYQYLYNIDGIFNVDRNILNRWRSPENPGDGITPTTNGAREIYRENSSIWVEDGSFLRIQNLTFGYTFPKNLLGRVGFLQHARIYGSIQNLVTFTKYSGANPDIVSMNDPNNPGQNLALAPGVDWTSYPLPRMMTLGLNVSF
ncbi:TonB-dependent receptor [Olivibacter sp. SDN3]|uniref:SusC/RagA family TonB-linked outer membrane protein n=1 Tax=Olivibacter sp. SDN3 TaxID=2764720 RepID=UPI001651A217|nr:TonB-dependent receptor [Olivibacter sp. SDN3]QNL50451.1 TonB-dependent receptor [Olivibacter sp. SDN3]